MRHARAAVAVVAIGVSSIVGAPAAAAAAPRVPQSQELVVLTHDHVARTWPGAAAPRIETVAGRRPLTRVRTVLPVLETTTSGGGIAWLRVRLPGRPNGHTGWINARQTRRSSTEWHIAVDVSARRVAVLRDGRVARRFRAVVGTPSTPTPRGRFFLEEAMSLSAKYHGGPFALATSARSNVLQEFEGGPGQIALHGTRGLPGALGTAASHGCIRLSARAITWLARRLGPGVPISIRR
jgi:lipoprotein-anchoring transpeptidase ErfK/SrfK